MAKKGRRPEESRVADVESDKALVIMLRIVGVSALFALVAVFMPRSWMAASHRWLGLGEMPIAPELCSGRLCSC
jgi:hypothetical protein